MDLPGTPNERIGDLRTYNKLSQKELSDLAGISPSQLSRIESGEIRSISSDILMKLAKALHVSTDYILGLSAIRSPKNYDVNELGLSEGATKNILMLKNSCNAPILNLLLEHKQFPILIIQLKSYFYDELAAGVMGRSVLFDAITAPLNDLRKENPSQVGDIQKDIRFINSEKYGKHEIDIEKIKNTFMTILKDIKKELGNNEMTDASVTSNMIQKIKEQLPKDTGGPPTAEQVASTVTQLVGQTGVLDEESAQMMQQLMLRMLKQSENR